MTEVKARLRHLRMSPRKVRLVVDAVRGLDVSRALARLSFMPKAAARPVRKLVESAVANARENHKLDSEGLFIKSARVDQGPSMKRWKPRAMGAANVIQKRTSHVTVVLDVRGKKTEGEKQGSKKK
jgi:large subunit ribosomal protein L22